MHSRIVLTFFLTWTCVGLCRAGIDSVSIDRDQVTIRGTSDTDRILELRPHEQAGGRSHPLEPGPDGAFALTLPRAAGYDRIDSRWQLGAGSPIWATDVTKAAAYPDLKPMLAKNRKGLGGIHPDPRLFDDLVALGVGHITVNIMLHEEFPDGQIAQLDRLLTFAHANGIIATAILLVPPRGSVMSHPDCDPSAKYALPNMTSAEGVAAFAKSVRFLAARYCEPGAPHGRISHWVVGNEVDAGWVWTNAGEKTAAEYMEEYHRALRVAFYSVRSFDPAAKVFISLTHHWNSAHQPDPKRFYKPRELLGLLAAQCEVHGDFEWGLAYHPYAENLFNPKTWQDQQALDSFDSPLITMKNIAVLDRFMRQRELLYQGKHVRSILLTEQGYHTDARNPQGEALQAAAIVFAWQQLKPLESIEAFHYHRWIDHEREGGLNLGLWTVIKGSTTWPDRKKRSWQVFQTLGTPAEAQATAFAEKILSP